MTVMRSQDAMNQNEHQLHHMRHLHVYIYGIVIVSRYWCRSGTCWFCIIMQRKYVKKAMVCV